MSLSSRRSAPAQPAAPSSVRRHGFTLAELIVALVLLTVGLLALASTSAFLTYEHASSTRAEHAARVAAERLEALRGGECVALQGSETANGVRTTWSVDPTGRAALATVQVSWVERGTPTSQRYAGGFTCDR